MTADHDTLAVAERTGAQSQMTIDEKKAPIATDLELVPSEKNGEVEVISEADYSPVEYKTILRKIDRFLLPLMWFCYGTKLMCISRPSKTIADLHTSVCSRYSRCPASKGYGNASDRDR